MKCVCGGTRTDHREAATDGCECSVCCRLELAEKCRSFAEAPKTQVETARAKAAETRTTTGSDHPDTSQEAAAKVLPNSGTQRRTAYDLIVASKDRGMTDDELERAMMKPHQSVSARRNELSADELILDSGKRRRTKSGHEATVWVAAPLDGSALQPSFDFERDDAEVEDEAEPEFDNRIVVLASYLAGRFSTDSKPRDAWSVMKIARDALAELGMEPGDAPSKPEEGQPLAA